MFAQTKWIVSSTFSKVAPARRERKNGSFFLQSFFFEPLLAKKKRLTSIDSKSL
jgi:hypothetical protein